MFYNMFYNVGSKLKTIARVFCFIGIVASIIGGILLMREDQFWEGVLIMCAGSFVSWLSSLSTYAIGETNEICHSFISQSPNPQSTDSEQDSPTFPQGKIFHDE